MRLGREQELVTVGRRGRHRGRGLEMMREVWRVAEEEARETYASWRELGGREAYLRYRAAADRADAALDGLSGAQ
ncbi:MAG: hypothetical protein JWQ18_2731 [Conexibacter sp.]|nr:hypothetical protein [Conexibacter sp.]